MTGTTLWLTNPSQQTSERRVVVSVLIRCVVVYSGLSLWKHQSAHTKVHTSDLHLGQIGAGQQDFKGLFGHVSKSFRRAVVSQERSKQCEPSNKTTKQTEHTFLWAVVAGSPVPLRPSLQTLQGVSGVFLYLLQPLGLLGLLGLPCAPWSPWLLSPLWPLVLLLLLGPSWLPEHLALSLPLWHHEPSSPLWHHGWPSWPSSHAKRLES